MTGAGSPDQSDVDQLRTLLDLMANFPDNDQRARYLLSSNWMQGKQEQALAELQRERDKLRDFQERVLAAAEQWKERGYAMYEACGMAVDDLMNGGDGYV